jgi:hypothetical protein
VSIIQQCFFKKIINNIFNFFKRENSGQNDVKKKNRCRNIISCDVMAIRPTRPRGAGQLAPVRHLAWQKLPNLPPSPTMDHGDDPSSSIKNSKIVEPVYSTNPHPCSPHLPQCHLSLPYLAVKPTRFRTAQVTVLSSFVAKATCTGARTQPATATEAAGPAASPASLGLSGRRFVSATSPRFGGQTHPNSRRSERARFC